MKLWIVCFVIIFGSFELYQWICQVAWLADVQMSLPVVVAGGIMLAIASNYDRASGLPFNPGSDGTPKTDFLSPPQPMPLQPTTQQTSTQTSEPCQRPISFQILTQPKRSISFEIQKSSNQGVKD